MYVLQPADAIDLSAAEQDSMDHHHVLVQLQYIYVAGLAGIVGWLAMANWLWRRRRMERTTHHHQEECNEEQEGSI
jgi:hypothetical protein